MIIVSNAERRNIANLNFLSWKLSRDKNSVQKLKLTSSVMRFVSTEQ